MKDSTLTLRLSSDDKRLIQHKAAQLELSAGDYIRKLALDDKSLQRAANKRELQERARQLARIGNNLNQLMKWLHSFRSEKHKSQTLSLKLEAIESMLERIESMLRSERGD